MKRLFCGIFVAGLTISAIGCGGGAGPSTTPPEDTGEVAPEAPNMEGNETTPPPPLGAPPS